MDESLQQFLLRNNYTKVKLHLTKTNHFEIIGKINNVKGIFILDTGASSSCIGKDKIEKFKLTVADSEVKAAGAGAIGMDTQLSKNNSVKFRKWKLPKVQLIVFDLSHVNTALENHNSKPVDGIIGADILKKGKAVIDYQKKYLYLKSI